MNDMKNETDYLLKGAIYGLIATAILWLILGGGLFLTFGNLERIILISGVGITIWGITWGIAGALIGSVGSKSAKRVLIGSVFGIIIGVVSATIAISWPRCNYGNMIDKVLWAIPVTLEMPVLSLLIPLNVFLQKTLNISLEQGRAFEYGVMIICSAIVWAVFGAILGKFIGRESKIKLP